MHHNASYSPLHALAHRPWRLYAVAAGVVLAHGALLNAASEVISTHYSAVSVEDVDFSTYLIDSAPPPHEIATVNPTGGDHTKPETKLSPTRLKPPPATIEYANVEEQGPPDETPAEVGAVAANNTDTQVAATQTDSVATLAEPPQRLARANSLPKAVPGSLDNKEAPVNTHVVLPPPARLLYDVKGEVKGFPYHVNGELLWNPDGNTYSARMEFRHFLMGSRVQTSTGTLGPQGLEPIRFGDKVKSEVAAHFQRDKGKVSFSANTPDAELQPGAQDQLSVLVQVAAQVAAQGDAIASGAVLAFQAVGPRSSETWRFTVDKSESLTLPGGTVQALRLWRDPLGEYDPKLEIWLAPKQGYLPVRIRLTQRNGDFVDQLWRETRKP